jgi:hypothetical protein
MANPKPFDVFVIETSYLTVDNLRLFLLSFREHFRGLADWARLVVCINSGDEDANKRSALSGEILSICDGYRILLFDCDRSVCDKWRSIYGPNAKPELVNLSHGHAIHEYLEKHSDGVESTLLCHSDIEFLGDMSATILSRQRTLEDPSIAAVATWEYPPSGGISGDEAIAECMDSACSLWKTRVLFEYAITRNIELGGVDLRKENGLFYDTGAYLQESVKRDYRVLIEKAPVRHWGGVTSILLSAGPVDWYQTKMVQVRSRVRELLDV